MDIEIKEVEVKSIVSSPLKLSSYHSRPRSAYSYKKILAKSADPCLPDKKGRF
jgi:hypothetical protein